jgi:aldehyde dehydrogenase (NAD+)
LSKGYFFEPTVFTDVESRMQVSQQEIFGPVVCVLSFDGDETVASLANDVRYGLVAGIYTRDVTRALLLASKLEAGQIWINDWFVGGVQAPMGGYKDSGQGREKGLRGIENYLQVKNIGVALT